MCAAKSLHQNVMLYTAKLVFYEKNTKLVGQQWNVNLGSGFDPGTSKFNSSRELHVIKHAIQTLLTRIHIRY